MFTFISALVLTISLSNCASIQHWRNPASIFPEAVGITEGGALPLNEKFNSVARKNSNDAITYQFQSFGNTILIANLKPGGSAQNFEAKIVGPVVDLGGNSVTENTLNRDLLAQDKVTLTTAGVYRITVKSGEFSGQVQCVQHCYRGSIPASQLVKNLKDSGKWDAFRSALQVKLQTLVSDEILRKTILAELDAFIAQENYAALDRFPALSLKDIGKIRGALSLYESTQTPSAAPPPPAKVNTDLVSFLGDCQPSRAYPAPLSPLLPEMVYGDFNNMAMSDCQWDRSNKLASLLTSLSVDNGSSVTYNNQNLVTPAQLISALIEQGHHVEMRNERTYANFLSLMLGSPSDPNSKDAKWPTWIKTGIFLKDKSELLIPMGHSQHAWRITGPLVNAQFTFFFGIYGTGFFAQTDVRPGWTGLRSLYKMDSDQGQTPTILKALDLARQYYRRNAYEASTIAKGMSSEGYGYLGVCNDSTAMMEKLYQPGPVTEYPLVRANGLPKSDAAMAKMPDSVLGNLPLDSVLANLPHDADGIPSVTGASGRADVLKRIAQMTPYSLNSKAMIDEALRAQLKEAVLENPLIASEMP